MNERHFIVFGILMVSVALIFVRNDHNKITEEYERNDSICKEKGGDYYTEYGLEGVGCYKVIQKRIEKKLY